MGPLTESRNQPRQHLRCSGSVLGHAGIETDTDRTGAKPVRATASFTLVSGFQPSGTSCPSGRNGLTMGSTNTVVSVLERISGRPSSLSAYSSSTSATKIG